MFVVNDGAKRYKLAKVSIFMAVVIVLIITTAVFLYDISRNTLVLFDGETGKLYGKWEASDGKEFSVEFIHSVNKSPVKDFFVIRVGKIYADRTVYSAFGAGVQTEVGPGQRLEFDEDGNMIVSGFDIEFPQVKYIVGTVSDHVLFIEAESISLTELCGRNSHVVFEIR